MQRNKLVLGGALLNAIAGSLAIDTVLSGAFAKGPTKGPFTADKSCPIFRPKYRSCEIRFGNTGLSTLASFYETFVGEGAFEITGFEVETLPASRFNIVAQSNRGPIRSMEIVTCASS